MEAREGLEPPISRLQVGRITNCATGPYIFLEGSLRVELSLAALQAASSPRGNHPRV